MTGAAHSFSQNVTHLQKDGRDIYIVGTAHISQRSVDEVKEVIEAVRPDTVCVELDEMRLASMMDKERFRKLDIFDVIREKKVLFLMSSLILSAHQKKMGEALGVEPGAELMMAVNTCKSVGAELVLADRNIQATLKRTWANLSLINKAKLASTMIGAFFAAEKVSEAQIEELKDRDTINEMMQAFAEEMPQVQVPLIDERDRYLMSAINDAPGKTIVAVVGAGHVGGMLRYQDQEVDREALSEIPPPGKLMGLLKWLIPAIVLMAFYVGYRDHQGEGLAHMLYAWVLPNSIVAAALGALAGAKPLTLLVAFVGSPITSLNPTIGSGMLAGLSEAWLRKPTVADCEGIPKAMDSVKAMYQNPFTRVLLVAVAVSLGSSLGAFVGATWVVSLL